MELKNGERFYFPLRVPKTVIVGRQARSINGSIPTKSLNLVNEPEPATLRLGAIRG